MHSFLDTYQDYLNHKPKSIRNRLRDFAINLSSPSNQKVEKNLPEKGIWFLTMHSLFSDKRNNFINTLKYINKQFEFISYGQAVTKLLENNIDGRYACLSVDDGFKNFLQIAEICDSFGFKAMVFVNPSMVGETNFDIIKKHCADRLGSPPTAFLDWNDIDKLLKQGHEIGNHGLKHLKLSTIADDHILQEEIFKSKYILDEKIGTVNHYAWAYGQQKFITDKAIELVFNAGHTSLASAVRGMHYKGLHESKQPIIKRELIECFYPIEHTKYFLNKSGLKIKNPS